GRRGVGGSREMEGGGEKEVAGGDGGEGGGVGGSGAAVRAALPDDGLPPLAASGLKLHDRLDRIAASLDRVAAKAGDLPGGLVRLRQLLRRGLGEAAALFPAVRGSYKWVKRAPRGLKNGGGLPGKKARA